MIILGCFGGTKLFFSPICWGLRSVCHDLTFFLSVYYIYICIYMYIHKYGHIIYIYTHLYTLNSFRDKIRKAKSCYSMFKKHPFFFSGRDRKATKMSRESRLERKISRRDETRPISIGAGVYLSWSCVDGRYFKGRGGW